MKRKDLLRVVITAVIFSMLIFVSSCGKGSEGDGETDKSSEEMPAAAQSVLFAAYHPSYGNELWKSDGTEAGTVLVKDINTIANPYEPLARLGGGVPMGDTLGSSPQEITEINGVYYFTADDGAHGSELWKSDGTGAGTVLVKDIYPGTDVDGFPNSSSPYNFTAVNDTLYFVAYNDTSGSELWKSDGTKAGTVLVKDIYAGSSGSYPNYLTAFKGLLFFQASDNSSGSELWKSNGTDAGTLPVKDIYAGSSSSSPYNLTAVNDTLYFVAYEATNGSELWKSNGTDAGTLPVKDIYAGSSGSYPNYLTAFKGLLFFQASDNSSGSELWKSNGTDAGTLPVKDIYAGSSGSNPQYLTAINGNLYFQANDGINGSELWKSNGTDAGTTLLKDINPGESYGPGPSPLSSYPGNFTDINGVLFFIARDYTHGLELWKSDGTQAGTLLVRDILTGEDEFGPLSSSPSYFMDGGDTLFFAADDGVHGFELWRSDGTEAGTVLVKDINEGVSSAFAFGRDSIAR